MEVCTIIKCGKEVVAKGYCNKHYLRFRVHNDPNKTIRNMEPPLTCAIENCNRKYSANGMCHYHYIKKYHASNRLIVLNHYCKNNIKCQCCGEKIIKFLTIDHINNDGYSHKRGKRRYSGHDLIEWLIRNNFPEGFTVLCFNCNCGRAVNNGVCPHKVS